jgi:hypothetical protein
MIVLFIAQIEVLIFAVPRALNQRADYVTRAVHYRPGPGDHGPNFRWSHNVLDSLLGLMDAAVYFRPQIQDAHETPARTSGTRQARS